MTRSFYRVVRSNPPTRQDFLSHEALGIPLRNEQQRELWSGVSCQATEQQARRTARLPGFGSFIARVELAEGGSIKWQRTGPKAGHHTLWGDPDELLANVVEVVPV